jgi:hypothetical protein
MQTTLTSYTAGKNGGMKAVCAVTCVRLSQMEWSHTGHVVPRCGETFDCFKLLSRVAFSKRYGVSSFCALALIRVWGGRLITVIEAFCDETRRALERGHECKG